MSEKKKSTSSAASSARSVECTALHTSSLPYSARSEVGRSCFAYLSIRYREPGYNRNESVKDAKSCYTYVRKLVWSNERARGGDGAAARLAERKRDAGAI